MPVMRGVYLNHTPAKPLDMRFSDRGGPFLAFGLTTLASAWFQTKERRMGAILLWLLGIPIPLIILIALLT